MLKRCGNDVVVAAAGGALVVGLWLAGCQGPEQDGDRAGPVPDTLRIPAVVANLSATFDRAAVRTEALDDPVRMGRLEPGLSTGINAPHRRAIIAPPRSDLGFRVRVPPGAVLRFGVGVERERRRESATGGVRFAVQVDGRTVFSRVVDPASRRRDRRWFDERVELDIVDERDVDLLLTTEPASPGGDETATPGWSHLRIVTETVRDRQRASADAPNLLILLVDALRADRMGCYGAEPSPSPTTDALARDGLVFDSMVSQAPWTLPSVATFLTGLHPRSHGAVGHTWEAGEELTDADAFYLSDEVRTVAAAARGAGLTTVAVSGSPLVSPGTNLTSGFEHFVGLPWDERRKAWATAAELNDVLLEWVGRHRAYRFFGYVHYMDVHGPYDPPAPHRPAARDDVRPVVAGGRIQKIQELIRGDDAPLTAAEISYLRALYDGQIRYWDEQLAALRDGLSALGVLEDTVVMIISDHGDEFLEHGHVGHGPYLHDELLRIPFIVHGTSRRGRVSTQVQGIDVLPTSAAVLDLPGWSGLPGRNLLASLDERAVVSETRSAVSVRTPDWKLIRGPGAGEITLYDLEHDPGERQDRVDATSADVTSADAASVRADLLRVLGDWEDSVAPPPVATGRDPAFREKLEALGYIRSGSDEEAHE